jgi:hypothetical protein
MAGMAAWAAGTAIAVTLAWLGAEVVLRHGVAAGPQVPAPSAASASVSAPPRSPGPSGSSSPASSPGRRPAPRRSPPPGSLRPRPSPPASPRLGTVRSYALTGGRVTLLMAKTSVRLIAATPVVGFLVQVWSAAGWLRVDFSHGSAVSSLIATWNARAPTVQIFTA